MAWNKQHRKTDYDYSLPGYYFITCNELHRKLVFGEIVSGVRDIILSEAGKIVEEEWFRTEEIRKEVTLIKHQVMPDHFHGIIKIGDPVLPEFIPEWEQFLHVPKTPGHQTKFGPQKRTLGRIVGSFKGECTKRIKKIIPSFDWQTGTYDEIIRDMTTLRVKIKYIEDNVARWKRKRGLD